MAFLRHRYLAVAALVFAAATRGQANTTAVPNPTTANTTAANTTAARAPQGAQTVEPGTCPTSELLDTANGRSNGCSCLREDVPTTHEDPEMLHTSGGGLSSEDWQGAAAEGVYRARRTQEYNQGARLGVSPAAHNRPARDARDASTAQRRPRRQLDTGAAAAGTSQVKEEHHDQKYNSWGQRALGKRQRSGNAQYTDSDCVSGCCTSDHKCSDQADCHAEFVMVAVLIGLCLCCCGTGAFAIHYLLNGNNRQQQGAYNEESQETTEMVDNPLHQHGGRTAGTAPPPQYTEDAHGRTPGGVAVTQQDATPVYTAHPLGPLHSKPIPGE